MAHFGLWVVYQPLQMRTYGTLMHLMGQLLILSTLITGAFHNV